jgi:glutaredoxin 3
MQAIIWTKNGCPYCEQAKFELKLRKINYEERNIQNGWTKEQLLEMVPNARTVPQIFIDNIYVGGYTELMSYNSSS